MGNAMDTVGSVIRAGINSMRRYHKRIEAAVRDEGFDVTVLVDDGYDSHDELVDRTLFFETKDGRTYSTMLTVTPSDYPDAKIATYEFDETGHVTGGIVGPVLHVDDIAGIAAALKVCFETYGLSVPLVEDVPETPAFAR